MRARGVREMSVQAEAWIPPTGPPWGCGSLSVLDVAVGR